MYSKNTMVAIMYTIADPNVPAIFFFFHNFKEPENLIPNKAAAGSEKVVNITPRL